MKDETCRQLAVLQRLLSQPLAGPSVSLNEFAKDQGISRRSVEVLVECGELAAFKVGKCWRIPEAAKRDFVRRQIEARIRELEALTE